MDSSWCERCGKFTFTMNPQCNCVAIQYRIHNFDTVDEYKEIYSRRDLGILAEQIAEEHFQNDPCDNFEIEVHFLVDGKVKKFSVEAEPSVYFIGVEIT